MRALFVPNIRDERAVEYVRELVIWCAGQGVEPVLAAGDAVACDLASYGVTASEVGEPALVVALGGDGTILKAVHLLGEVEVPLLGVKFGRLGFLSGATPEDAREAITSALAGEACIERRATLSAEVLMDGRSVGVHRALNEIVLNRSTSRVVRLGIAVNGNAVSTVTADGVIVATATGSTAYALSAGGPIVSPGFGGMVVVPVAAHTLSSRSLVTDASDVVEITAPDPLRADVGIVVDGAQVPLRRALDRLIVKRGSADVLLVKWDGRDFYRTVAREFFGG